jgi:hypothetical protein
MSDDVEAVLEFSELYRRFWGLENETRSVRQIAAVIEEFSTPVGTMGRMMGKRVFRSSCHLYF